MPWCHDPLFLVQVIIYKRTEELRYTTVQCRSRRVEFLCMWNRPAYGCSGVTTTWMDGWMADGLRPPLLCAYACTEPASQSGPASHPLKTPVAAMSLAQTHLPCLKARSWLKGRSGGGGGRRRRARALVGRGRWSTYTASGRAHDSG